MYIYGVYVPDLQSLESGQAWRTFPVGGEIPNLSANSKKKPEMRIEQ